MVEIRIQVVELKVKLVTAGLSHLLIAAVAIAVAIAATFLRNVRHVFPIAPNLHKARASDRLHYS